MIGSMRSRSGCLNEKPIAACLIGTLEDVDTVVKEQAFNPLLEAQVGDKQISVMKLQNPEIGGSRRWIIFYHPPCPTGSLGQKIPKPPSETTTLTILLGFTW